MRWERVGVVLAGLAVLLSSTLGHAQDSAERLKYAHAVYRSHVEFQNGNAARSLELLESCPEKLRGWEWNYVRRLCRPEMFSIEPATADGKVLGFQSAAYSPDGRRIITANGSKTATIWNAETGARESELTDNAVIRHARYSADGSRIVTTGAVATAGVWDAKTGKKLLTLKRARTIGPASFSADGKRIVSSSHRELTIWNAETGEEIRTFPSAAFDQCRPSFSPDGKRIVADGFTLSAVFDADQGTRLFDIPSGGDNTPAYARFSPDGKLIAVAYRDGTCRLHSAANGNEIRTLKGHASSVASAAFSADGKRIVTSGSDRTLRVWDTETGRQLSSRQTTGAVADATFDSEGKHILGLEAGGVKVWPAAAVPDRELQSPLGGWITDLKFSPSGKHLAVANNAGIGYQVEIWNTEKNAIEATITNHDYMVHNIAFTPDGTRLFSRTGTGRTKIFDTAKGELQHDLAGTGKTSLNIHASFASNGKRIRTVKSGEISEWDVKTGEKLRTLKSTLGGANKVWDTPDGKTVIALIGSKHLQSWNAETGDAVRDVELEGLPAKLSNAWLTPDAARIFIAVRSEPIRCFDVKTGKALFSMPGARLYNEEQFAISPDGTRLATAHGGDKAVHIWDAANGEELMVIPCHTKGIACVAFSTDGSRIATAPTEGPVRILNGAPFKK